MEFKFGTSIFRNKAEDNKNNNPKFPTHGGMIKLPVSQVEEFVEYLHWAMRTDLETDKYLNEKCIPIKLAGWQKDNGKEGESRKVWLSIELQPHFKTKNAALEAKEASQLSEPATSVEDAAASLAQGTAGTVVIKADSPSSHDLPF